MSDIVETALAYLRNNQQIPTYLLLLLTKEDEQRILEQLQQEPGNSLFERRTSEEALRQMVEAVGAYSERKERVLNESYTITLCASC